MAIHCSGSACAPYWRMQQRWILWARRPRSWQGGARRSPGADMTVRVFIVDGHPLFRIGVRALLEDAATLDLVGEASTGEVAVDALQKLEPSADVVLVDHPLTNSSAIETTRMITSKLLSEI